MDDTLSFGQWLRQRRRALDWTQGELARRIGCAPITVRRFEADELKPSKQLAALLAERVGIPSEERDAFVEFARGGRKPTDLTVLTPGAEPAPWRTARPFKSNLPRPLDSFIGRERERAELERLLAATSLLTLTGTGGVGKTRLALQVASELGEEFRDGVWLVGLAALSDPLLVTQAVAKSLGVQEEPNRKLILTLADYLKEKQLLLVLDNCEHLIDACAQLVDNLLRKCPRLKVMATSRERLAVPGEALYSVPALALPDLDHLPTLQDLSRIEGVRLFVERARAAQPGWALTAENAKAVASICRRLDGLPLAIELAAARVKLLTPAQIESRLDNYLQLLAGSSRTVLPHHQTLQAAIDWSYDLLTPQQQQLFRRLSVFAGGCTLEAVEDVCAEGADGEGIMRNEVLDLLSSLVDKSLVSALTHGAESYFRLLETIRRHAHAKLLETGEAGRLRDKHFHWFVRLAQRAEPELQGPDQAVWLERLEVEHDNFLAALDWSVTGAGSVEEKSSRIESALVLAGALCWFWRVRGYFEEGRERLTTLLARPETAGRTPARAKALYGAGALALAQGDEGAARQMYEESLAIAKEQGGKPEIVEALLGLGAVAQAQGDHNLSSSLYTEALGLSRGIDYEWGIATSLLNLGFVTLNRGDYGVARSFLDQALTIFRRLEDKGNIAKALVDLGLIEYYQRDYDRARSLYRESLRYLGELKNKRVLATTLDNLGYIELRERNYDGAREYFSQSLASFREFGKNEEIVDVLQGFAGLAMAEHQPERAAQLLAAIQALVGSNSAGVASANRAEYDRLLSQARARLQRKRFEAAWNQGERSTLAEAVEYALAAQNNRKGFASST